MTRMELPISNFQLPIEEKAEFPCSIGNRQSAIGNQRRAIRQAFSLVEMMIAIVLLGLGMVMVATMFPVAWTRARQLNEATNLRTVVTAADTVVRNLARVDGRDSDGSAFAGDLVFVRNGAYGLPPLSTGVGGAFAYSDTLVHALSMDNLLISPRRFQSQLPWDRQPWTVNRLDRLIYGNDPPLDALQRRAPNLVSGGLFTSSQVSFGARFHPPMRNRVPGSDFTMPDPAWDEMLDSRRYAWAVLHRLRNPICPVPDPTDPAAPPLVARDAVNAYDQIDVRREFDIFYVMLRRPQSTYRFAQQDSNSAPPPFPVPGWSDPSTPSALPPEQDVILPEPWRVQMFFQLTNDPAPLPTETQINYPTPAATHPMLVDMFPAGASFIDERSGLILQVVRRRLGEKSNGDAYAFLTLDRKIVVDGIHWDNDDVVGRLRTVWVFPPPVQAVRGTAGAPIFDGVQPVVAIERRTLAISPAN